MCKSSWTARLFSLLMARPFFRQRRKSSPGFLRKYWVSSSSNRQCCAGKRSTAQQNHKLGSVHCSIHSNQASVLGPRRPKGIWGKERPVPLRPVCKSGLMTSIKCVLWMRFRSVGKGREGRTEWTGKGRVGTFYIRLFDLLRMQEKLHPPTTTTTPSTSSASLSNGF